MCDHFRAQHFHHPQKAFRILHQRRAPKARRDVLGGCQRHAPQQFRQFRRPLAGFQRVFDELWHAELQADPGSQIIGRAGILGFNEARHFRGMLDDRIRSLARRFSHQASLDSSTLFFFSSVTWLQNLCASTSFSDCSSTPASVSFSSYTPSVLRSPSSSRCISLSVCCTAFTLVSPRSELSSAKRSA